MSKNVVTRIAPSPTGFLHVGTARAALFNYLFARQHKGTFLLRLEDTDKERSKKEFEEDILDGLAWLGIEYDEKVVKQSERTQIYITHLEKLIDSNSAYEGEASEKGAGKVIRFKNPNKEITFEDIIRGSVTFDTTELGDFVIARSIRDPLYQLAVVVDDIENSVTHVIRGEDLLPSTQRQILILEALKAERPRYAHIPLVLASDRSKLSKRHGATAIHDYKEMGIVPEAMINYLALLGWHPKDEQEIFSKEELVEVFELERVQKGGAIFDMEKLRSINKKHLENISDGDFLENLKKRLEGPILALIESNKGRFEQLVPLFRERIEIFSDIKEMAENGELEYFFRQPEYSREELSWKDDADAITHKHLTHVMDKLSTIDENTFTKETVKESVWSYADEQGRGSVLWPLRYALSGRKKSPDPFLLAEILGKEETIKRLEHALQLLS